MTLYFDHSTTARLSSASLNKMQPYFREHVASPYSTAKAGQELLGVINESKEALYKLVGGKKDDTLIFTSSHAEAINHVILSAYLDVTRQTGKNHFVTSSVDEAPTILAMTRLKDLGCVMQMAQVSQKGVLTKDAFIASLSPRTALVSLSLASALTGVVHPISEIGAICKDRGILLHLDITHVLQSNSFDWESSGASFITFNGEPIHAPKGTGALFVKSGVEISPFILGGKEQGGYRGGSFNTPAFIGLGHAAKEVHEGRDYFCTEVARLRDLFEELVCKELPLAKVHFKEEERLPHVSCIDFPGVSGEAFLFYLNQKGLTASFGGGNFQQLPLILKASTIKSHSSLSFSLSRDTLQRDVEKGVEVLLDCYKQLKKCWGG